MKLSPHARAIRDVEDEELRSFFYGMSPWQVNELEFLLEIQYCLGESKNQLIHSYLNPAVYTSCCCKLCGRGAFLQGCRSGMLSWNILVRFTFYHSSRHYLLLFWCLRLSSSSSFL